MQIPILFPLNVTSCYTASPIFPSHFLHAKFFENFGVALFTPAHLPWIHLPHCTHKIEFAFTLKLQTPHRSTLHLDMPSFVMLLLTITFVFSRLTFKPLLSKASIHFKSLFQSPLIVSRIRARLSACSNSHSSSSGKFSDNIYHHFKKKW